MSPISQKSVVYDMASDTATVQTDDMFDIMKAASRGDDVYSADQSVHELEAYMADLLGHEAALFCVSGCMTNQIGLRLHLTQPPHSVLCDARAHVQNNECGGIAYHSQASVSLVQPKNGIYMTAKEVEANICTDDMTGAPTKVISLENTLNGMIMPLEEIKKIHAVARAHGLKMHLDGARLFNASQATNTPLHEYGKLFDTVSVCLSKGAGAPIGSVLVGSKDLMRRARHIRKMMGGGWRQAGMLAAVAKYCVQTVVPTLPETHRLAGLLAKELEQLGIHLPVPCHTNMVFLDLTNVGLVVQDLADELRKHNILISSNPGTVVRVVLHYQISEQAVKDFIKVATDMIAAKAKSGFVPKSKAEPADLKSAYPSAKKRRISAQ
ncbi:Threonine aldolase [Apophysomyces sp. BC1034]|nr:Threonine aldolase [Apophysomyces sp. BC1015]KAG0168091.1 Threonine aldolase [Apophysomyces sp. BC1021]KAG0192494.1 Threonine aldolase [Apophysomyces sp. BC1034]